MAQPRRVPLPTRDPQQRAGDFQEVATGYDAAMAREEAARCLQCKHRPCVGGCPVGIDIPGFIGKIAQGDDEGA